MIIAGILAATVLPRFGGRHGFEERGFRDETLSALRYAQKSAIASRRPVCVTFTATALAARIANAPSQAPVATDCNGAAGSDLIGPSGQPLAVDSKGGASFKTLPAALAFNALGQPSAGAVITVAGLETVTITVEADTGYVH